MLMLDADIISNSRILKASETGWGGNLEELCNWSFGMRKSLPITFLFSDSLIENDITFLSSAKSSQPQRMCFPSESCFVKTDKKFDFMCIYPLQYPQCPDLLSSVITRIMLSTLVLRVKYKFLIFHTAVFLPVFCDFEPHLPTFPKTTKKPNFYA